MRSFGPNAFTFIEILACLLVVSLGVAAAVGMAMYGLGLGETAQGRATGMATALSVAVDPSPLLSPANQASWSQAGPSGIGRTTGWINGFYIVRTETLGVTPIAGFSNDPVSVDVYDGLRGHTVASYSTCITRQAAP